MQCTASINSKIKVHEAYETREISHGNRIRNTGDGSRKLIAEFE